MVIFHSYVKLPEGMTIWSSGLKSFTHQLPSSQTSFGVNLVSRGPAMTAACNAQFSPRGCACWGRPSSVKQKAEQTIVELDTHLGKF